MPSSALRIRELRAVHELTHECFSLGDDVGCWRRHLVTRLAALTGADLAVGGELTGCRAGSTRNVGEAEWGWGNGFNRTAWLQALAELPTNARSFRLLTSYTDRLNTDDGVSLPRTGMMDDREWYRSLEFQNVLRSIGVDHTLWCFRTIGGTHRDEFSGVILYRANGIADFNPRAATLLREAHTQLVPHVGRALARYADPSPAALAPRVREVLRCLLEGDSDKQIAVRLRISKFTVNQYVKVIFNHFGVTTRTELLARWIRRGWGNGFAWANGDARASK